MTLFALVLATLLQQPRDESPWNKEESSRPANLFSRSKEKGNSVARYEVFLTEDAEADLGEIAEYIEFHDSAERSDHVFEKISESILKLESLPGRGRVVPELREVSVTEYREIVNKPYRILYFVSGKKVIVHGSFDGRRGIEELLSRRILR